MVLPVPLRHHVTPELICACIAEIYCLQQRRDYAILTVRYCTCVCNSVYKIILKFVYGFG